jgi:hypothetical protein
MVIKGRHILKAAIDWKNATTKLMQSTVTAECRHLWPDFDPAARGELWPLGVNLVPRDELWPLEVKIL